MTEQARDLIAKAFDVPASEIPETAAIGRFEAWTASRHAQLFKIIEAALGREMTGVEASDIQSVATLQTVLDRAEGRGA